MVKHQISVAMFGKKHEFLLKSYILNIILEVPVIATGQIKYIHICLYIIYIYMYFFCNKEININSFLFTSGMFILYKNLKKSMNK